ncbi:hypothetical protein D9M72_395070 [compost metagenome]
MHRQQLHRFVVDLRGRDVQPALLRCRGFQPGQERQDIHAVRGVEESCRGIVECVQVSPGLVDADAGAGRHLDVEEHGPFHFAQKRREVIAHKSAELPEFSRQGMQPVEGCRAQRPAVGRGPSFPRQPVQGFHKARRIGDVALDHRGVRIVSFICVRPRMPPAAREE